MSNLIISRRCNQSCPYCFAEESLTPAAAADDFISLDAFEERLDYLDRSGIDQARLIGGEPTLHPQFAELVQRALAHGKTVVVFTNGLMPDAALAALADLPAGRCGVILNITAMEGAAKGAATGTASLQSAAAQRFARQQAVLRRLGQKAQIGVNLYRLDQALDFILPLIEDTGCKPALRVGLAQPVLSGKNAFLSTKHYAQTGAAFTRFAVAAARQGVRVELDCGFVRCMFSEDEYAQLTAAGIFPGFHCGPILDIDLDGTVFHCFSLAEKFQTHLGPQDRADELREALVRRTQAYRQAGIYKECSSCVHAMDQSCSGGCLSNTIRRFIYQPFSVAVPQS
jgi:sulfatase maturation enzyme AslB (radical SAM superfamily)